jgi:hypothetical protein
MLRLWLLDWVGVLFELTEEEVVRTITTKREKVQTWRSQAFTPAGKR